MKTLLKSFLFVLTLSILSYSAIQAGAQEILVGGDDSERTCCQYQVDCGEKQTCEFIFPYCSENKNYICKAAATNE